MSTFQAVNLGTHGVSIFMTTFNFSTGLMKIGTELKLIFLVIMSFIFLMLFIPLSLAILQPSCFMLQKPCYAPAAVWVIQAGSVTLPLPYLILLC